MTRTNMIAPDLYHTRMCRIAAAVVLAVFAAAGLAGCSLDSTTEAAAEGQQPPTLIRVAPIERKTVSPRVLAVGSVTPRWMSIVASGADGLVEDFRIDEGQYLKRGDLIARLRMNTTDLGIKEAQALLAERKHDLDELEAGSRPEDIAEARAKMMTMRAAVSNAKRKLARSQQLYSQNALNENDLDDAMERADAAQHALDAAEAVYQRIESGPRVEEIEQARARYEAQKERVAYLEAEKEKRITRAPYDGFVVRNETFVGQWLSKGDPVVVMSMLDLVDIVVNVDQEDLQHVRVGDTAHVRVSGAHERDWEGEIVAVVPRSDWQSGSRGFPVEVRIENRFYETKNHTRQPYLKEGMMAEVTFQGDPVEALMISKDALVRAAEGMVVYEFEPDPNDSQTGTVRPVSVEAGISEGATIQVMSDNLQAGMLVVTEGAERVRPFEKPRLAAPPRDRNASPTAGEPQPPASEPGPTSPQPTQPQD